MVGTKKGLKVKDFGKFNAQDNLDPFTFKGQVEVEKGKWEHAEWLQDGSCKTHEGDDFFIGRTKHIPTTHDDIFNMSKDEKLERAFFFVEGKSYDCWKEYGKKEGVDWKQDNSGFMETISTLYRKVGRRYEPFPVNIAYSFAVINGVYVCFYDSPSLVSDWGKIEEHVTQYAGQYDSGSRRAMVNQDNFHNCFHYCEKNH